MEALSAPGPRVAAEQAVAWRSPDGEEPALDDRWRGPDFIGTGGDELMGAQANCWDDEATTDEVFAAAAISKSSSGSIFVKMPPLLAQADLAGKVYLDLGCGYGRTLLYACTHLNPALAIGLDISPVMLGKARAYADEHGADPVLARTSIDSLPLADESVDFVYAAAVFLHLPTEMVGRVVEETLRVLRPGGVALFEGCFPGWINPDGVQTKLITTLGGRWLRTAWVRTYRHSEVARLVRAAGPVARLEITPEGYKVLPKSVATIPLARLKPRIKRVNERAGRRLRFKSFLADGYSVRLVK